ncbi:histidinol-phosphate transaminase [Fusibacter ferrireducens]|uniref:Histidinol-phosphate transaminase n=1 Tax=Fusibacter ferrireducens TaxID=2785058 RepID=A0ABR9ZUK5_9FIRM|nr:histidinol-phosphate transaminase [Fusibacter ferrireducens]MBF4694150.1 histidinol-phosphate transaminase [Fusibacter ferrireducens]
MNALENMIKLDANELAYPLSETQIEKLRAELDLQKLNRYPDADAIELLEAYSAYIGIPQSQIIAGNGSDEVLDLIYKAFTTPKDIVLSVDPSFVMYEIMASIYKCEFRRYQPEAYYGLTPDNFIEYVEILKPKLIFICNPNNPTGALLNPEDLIKIIKSTDAYVVIDEAYGEFICDRFMDYSLLNKIDELPNLIVLKTLSKACGLAGLRIGFGLSNAANMAKLYSCKYPYTISNLSQALGIALLKSDFKETINSNRLQIIETRDRLIGELKQYKALEVFDSYANFIWMKIDSEQISKEYFLEAFAAKNIKIRYFKKDYLADYFRITVGTEYEAQQVMACIDAVLGLERAAGQ